MEINVDGVALNCSKPPDVPVDWKRLSMLKEEQIFYDIQLIIRPVAKLGIDLLSLLFSFLCQEKSFLSQFDRKGNNDARLVSLSLLKLSFNAVR